MPVAVRIIVFLFLARLGAAGLEDMILSVAGSAHRSTGDLWQTCLYERACAFGASAFLAWLLPRNWLRVCTILAVLFSAYAAWRFKIDPLATLFTINRAYGYVIGVPLGILLSRKNEKIFGLEMAKTEDRMTG